MRGRCSRLLEAPYVGVLFIALEITLVALALALVVADTRPVWAACGIVPVLAIGAYVLSRLVPLPQMADDVGNWAEPLGVLSVGMTVGVRFGAVTAGAHADHLGAGRALHSR